MSETISFDVRVLAERLKRHQHFRIRLPHIKTVFVPEYRPQSLYIQGDIVVFSFDMKCILIGMVTGKTISNGIVFFDIDCIQRQCLPSNDTTDVNLINKIRIIRKDIICELIPEQK